MRTGIEQKMVGRVLAAVLLGGLLTLASATGAAAGGGDGGCTYGCTPPSSVSSDRAVTYPTPSTPPPLTRARDAQAPPTLARTGSNTSWLIGAGAGALLAGGGMVLVARRRRTGLDAG